MKFDESDLAAADRDLISLLEEHGGFWEALPVLGFDVEAVRCSALTAAEAFEARVAEEGDEVREGMAAMLVVYGLILGAHLTQQTWGPKDAFELGMTYGLKMAHEEPA